MKKYRHKILSGVTAEPHGSRNEGTYEIKGLNTEYSDFIYVKLLENSNDWEEIKEPTYLITAFKKNNTIFKIENNGKYYDEGRCGWPIEAFTKEEGYSIYKVKNSHGVEFTIGDKIKHNYTADSDKLGEIIEFKTQSNSIIVEFKRGFDRYTLDQALESIKKPEPILITEDGVEIFDKTEELYDVSTENWNFLSLTRAEHFIRWKKESMCLYRKPFKNKEAAESYIAEHKPIYSLSDIKKLSIKVIMPNFIRPLRDGMVWINLNDLKALNK